MHFKKLVSMLGLVFSLATISSVSAYADTSASIQNGSVNTVDGETYYITGKTSENSLNNISVNGGNVRIVLDNVDMNLSDWVEAIGINSGANVNLVLKGNNKITSGWGIIVAYGCTLNISGDGSLTVLARNSSAIGNILYDSRGMGNINIQSGTLDLKSEYGCGIGAAVSTDGVGKVGDITISGGHIKAVGSDDCAGIGSANTCSMGNIYIGGDSYVEASSVQGAGIGTGAPEKDADSNLGIITIGDEAVVNAVSYSGAGIGTGDNQNKQLNVNITGKAKVYAESYTANSIGDGEKSEIDSNINIADSTDVTLVSYRSNTLPDTSNTDITEITLSSAPLQTMNLSLKGADGKEDSLSVPKDCYTVATNKVTDAKVVGAEETKTVDSGTAYKKKEVVVNNFKKDCIYVSSRGIDSNNGATYLTPVRTFKKAYELAKSDGTIVICSGNIEIDRVAKLGKNVTISASDGKYNYNVFKPSITISSDNEKIYDSITIDGVNVIMDGKYNSKNMSDNFKVKSGSITRKTSVMNVDSKNTFASGKNKEFKRGISAGISSALRNSIGVFTTKKI